MKKFIKNRKGFTLIELMMVIAVIGILAAVLIPKIGATKTNAKLAGVDSNVRQVQAHVEGMIDRYAHNAGNFQNALISVINSDGNDSNANAGDIQNPFDNTKYGATTESTDCAVLINSLSNINFDGPEYAGLVRVNIVKDGTDITNVDIYAYDDQGYYLNSNSPVATVTP